MGKLTTENLDERILKIKKVLAETGLAHKRWQDDMVSGAQSRNYTHNAYKNIAITNGAYAADAVELINDLLFELRCAQEAEYKLNEKYAELKAKTQSDGLAEAADDAAGIKTAVVKKKG